MRRKSINVLLVEDDEDDYLMTRKLFSKIEDFRTKLDWVPTYEEAKNTIKNNKHSLYLIDYRLGKHNGLELMQEVLEKGSTTPVIMLTGYEDREIILDAILSGASDYLIKGRIDPGLLESSIRNALQL